MSIDLLIRNVRPMGRGAADVLVIDGTIAEIAGGVAPPSAQTPVLDGGATLPVDEPVVAENGLDIGALDRAAITV